jgi:glycerol uptake facilitator-like aquaporin
MKATLARRLAAEALGTAFLLMAVVGSGIMAERLAGGSVGLALLANSLATAFALVALITALAPVSGAHINPAVSLSFGLRSELGWGDTAAYVAAQLGGGVLGVAVANAMFGEPWLAASNTVRGGAGQLLGELVATFGLVGAIWAARRQGAFVVAWTVGAYIGAAYWFTSSTSFANPAVTVARAVTNTFAGIRPLDVGAFVLAQLAGAALATLSFAWLLDEETS